MVTNLTLTDLNACAPSATSDNSSTIAREYAEQLAVLLKAVADPTRLQLLALIESSSEQQSCVCDLTEPLQLSQPTVSHHLKVLAEAGLVNREKRGTWVWYQLNQDRWSQLANLFRESASAATQQTGIKVAE